MKNPFKQPVVILANGEFPSHKTPLGFLSLAGTVICADGSANLLRSLNLKPHIIIGDLDSISEKHSYEGLIVDDSSQSNTDLEKAIEFTMRNSVKEITVLGAVGNRDDMSFANIQLLFNYFKKIDIKIITDYFSIECISGKKIFKSFSGQRVSLATSDQNCTITTSNLKYSISGKIDPSLSLISNESLGDRFTLSSSDPLIVFRGHNNKL
tara:strand:+ start:1260 stop:1889 length:630 start_codon:yes stop_codon:yes gene_type:complete